MLDDYSLLTVKVAQLVSGRAAFIVLQLSCMIKDVYLHPLKHRTLCGKNNAKKN